MLKNDLDFHKAIRGLQLRIKTDDADQEELHKVLMQILAYPIVEEAEKHHRANNIGVMDLMSNQADLERQIREKKIQNLQVCTCCGLLVNNQQLPYCTNLSDINMGVGVHLFFKNYMVNILVFALMFLCYSIFALSTNLTSFNQDQGTQKDILCLMSSSTAANGCGFSAIGAGSKVLNQNDTKNHLSQIQSWIGVAFTILWGVIFIIKTHMDEKFLVDMETNRVSASDFTLMLEDVPRRILDLTYDETLKYLNQIFGTQQKKFDSLFSYEVIKFNVARPLYLDKKINETKKKEVQEQLRKRQDIFRRWIKHRKEYVDFPIRYADRAQQYQKYEEYFSTKYEFNANFQGELEEKSVVFVTLRSSKARQEIQKNNRPPSFGNFWNICGKNQFPLRGVTIRRAPEPEEIKWNHVGFSKYSRRLRKAGIWLLTIILIAISLGISIGISNINQNSVSEQASIGISIVVTCVNIGIQLFIMLLSTMENQFINSVEQSNIAFKIGIGQLLNSIGVPIVVTLIAKSNSSGQETSWLKAGGLVDNVFYIALFSMFVPFGRMVDPWEIFLKLKRWWASEPNRRLNMYGQSQLNKLYGNYQFDIGYEYCYLIKTSIFTAFFTPMQPIIAIFAPIGLGLYYCFDKRNLFRHFQRPNYHSAKIDKTVDFIMLFSLLAFGFGQLLVNNFLKGELGDNNNGTLITNWISVMVAGVFLFLVPFRIFYCCISKPNLPLWDYQDKKAILNSDYDRLNPATKSQAISNLEDHLNNLDKNNQLTNQSQLMRMSIMRQRQIRNPRNSMTRTKKWIQMTENGPVYNYNLDQYRNIAQNIGNDGNHKNGSGENLKNMMGNY